MAELDPESVTSFDHFIEFVRDASADMDRNPDKYANTSGSDFMEGLAAWLEDARGTRPEIEAFDQWGFIARILAAGMNYE